MLQPQQQQIICAISYSGKKIGAAIFDEEEKELKILHDIAEDNDFIMLGRREFKK